MNELINIYYSLAAAVVFWAAISAGILIKRQ
jgi:hypothetical protein